MTKRLVLLLKGMAMGGADVIPGVSGGTIALITGIYDQLIDAIRAMDMMALRMLLQGQIRALWTRINGGFLLNVLAGILLSIFSLARLITYLMEVHPIPLWSFFFGLILVSAFYVIPAERRAATYVALLAGAAVAWLITSLTPTSTPDALWFIFVAGAIAICAMILPGISGSFILLLLGKYERVLEAVKSFDWMVIAVFGLGCAVGIVAFSKLIHWLLSHYRSVTLGTLAGFMLGSLNKIWPWKELSGDSFRNISPSAYTSLTGQPNHLYLALLFCLAGIVLVIGLEWLGRKLAK